MKKESACSKKKDDMGYLSIEARKPMCGHCVMGHEVVWYVEPPPECPYCNRPMVTHKELCEELTPHFLSW